MAAAVAISSRPLWWGGVASILAAIAFFLSCLLNLAFLSGTAFKTKNPLIAFERNGTTIDATMQAKAFRKCARAARRTPCAPSMHAVAVLCRAQPCFPSLRAPASEHVPGAALNPRICRACA